MANVIPQSALVRLLAGPAAALLIFGSGCASSAQQSKDTAQVKQLKTRLEDMERTNGRLTVRVEELEDQLYLLHDRVEAQRIAMQRREPAARDAYAYASPRAPQPAPESYYGEGDAYKERVREAAPRRAVTRIPIHDEEAQPVASAPPAKAAQVEARRDGSDEEIVITEEQFREFERQYGANPPSSARAASTGEGASKRGGQPSVTDERIEQGRGPAKAAAPVAAAAQRADSAPAATGPVRSDKSGLAAYKEGLSEYRAGNYSQALGHFEAFLASNPQEDYVDNTLYWIGECHYGLGAFEPAIRSFERVLKEQPDGNKVPDAMLKMFLALDRSGRKDEADRVLRELTERYPTTNAGRLGLQKLNERR